MQEPRIQQQFFESADLLYQVAESLSRPLDAAAQMLVDGITGGNRVLCCGLGLSSLDARYMATLLLGRFEQDRPGLAALALTEQPEPARQVLSLGHPGDLLLLLDAHSAGAAALKPVLEAAHAQDMSVIALTGGMEDDLRTLLHDTDVQIRVPATRAARVAEAQRLLIHCLCDAVDLQLLGTNE
ncbi:MAG TPA: SIS domain-containing protein [Burkholderiaceae bacterium]|jgi:D-sedoheptulose 7-phosphate isomerase